MENVNPYRFRTNFTALQTCCLSQSVGYEQTLLFQQSINSNVRIYCIMPLTKETKSFKRKFTINSEISEIILTKYSLKSPCGYKLHTYIIFHYNSSVRIITWLLTLYCVRSSLYMNGKFKLVSLKSTTDDRRLRKFTWQFYLLSAFLPEIR